MKLKLSHRFTLYSGAVLMLALGAAAILGSILNNQIVISAEGQSFFSLGRLGFVLAGLLMVAFGFFCLSLPHRMKQSKSEHIVQKTPSGEMRINTQAIEALVQKSLSTHEEIKLQQLVARNARNGVEIELKASIANNINMPLAIGAIQRHIRQQLLATTGLEVRDISVTIEKTDQAAQSSPYLVKPMELSLPVNDSKPPKPDAKTEPSK